MFGVKKLVRPHLTNFLFPITYPKIPSREEITMTVSVPLGYHNLFIHNIRYPNISFEQFAIQCCNASF